MRSRSSTSSDPSATAFQAVPAQSADSGATEPGATGTESSAPAATWWGDVALDFGQTFHLTMGGFHVAITRLLHEWQIRYQREPERADLGEWNRVVDYNLPGRESRLERVSMEQNDGRLRLWPMLADRPVVIRPYHPLLLPPGESATIFVSTILVVQVQLMSSRSSYHHEILVQLPSETWMGPNTMDGELCYAEMTSARLASDSLPKRAYRAVTPLHIVNRGKNVLNLERVSLPVPMLDLYAAEDASLWTSEVTYTRGDEVASAKIEIGSLPPKQARAAQRLTSARSRPDKGVLVKAIDRLFG